VQRLSQLSHLVVCSTNRAEPLIPQRYVSRNLRRNGGEELRRNRRVDLDCARGVVVSEHLTRTGELERLDGDIGLVQDLQRLGIGSVREERSAKRMKQATGAWSAASLALPTACCATLTAHRTMPGIFRRPLPGCRISWL
jgi:hypothetical protein